MQDYKSLCTVVMITANNCNASIHSIWLHKYIVILLLNTHILHKGASKITQTSQIQLRNRWDRNFSSSVSDVLNMSEFDATAICFL